MGSKAGALPSTKRNPHRNEQVLLMNTHTPGALSMDVDIHHLQSSSEVNEKHPCCIADFHNAMKPQAGAHPGCHLLCLSNDKNDFSSNRGSQILHTSFMLDTTSVCHKQLRASSTYLLKSVSTPQSYKHSQQTASVDVVHYF